MGAGTIAGRRRADHLRRDADAPALHRLRRARAVLPRSARPRRAGATAAARLPATRRRQYRDAVGRAAAMARLPLPATAARAGGRRTARAVYAVSGQMTY